MRYPSGIKNARGEFAARFASTMYSYSLAKERSFDPSVSLTSASIRNL